MTRPSLLALSLGLGLSFSLLAPANPAWAQAQQGPEKSVPQAPDAAKPDTFQNLELFGNVIEKVMTDYVEEVDETTLIESAINGMLNALDPHSAYLNAKDFQDMQVQTKGKFGGLGIEVTMENGLIKVISPIEDTPAYRAGIQAGDFISHIDGQEVMGLTLNEAVDRMRGDPNTDIKLTILRPDTDPFDVTLTRAVIQVKSVRHSVEVDIGYIRITKFTELTEPGLQKAMQDIDKALGDKVRGYVLDLRNNPGGLLNQAIAVSDAFLEQGEIVSTRSRRPEDIQRYHATAGDMAHGKPIVVLVNAGSASASEIVAGALQDHKRAIIMGTKSFGKGSVQVITPLGNHGALKLTTSRYYTPSGRSIQAVGVEPDINVQQAKLESVANSRRRSEADLRNALTNDNGKNGVTNGQPAAKPEGAKPEGAKTPEGQDGEAAANVNAAEDYQLARALDLIRGLSLYNQAPAAR